MTFAPYYQDDLVTLYLGDCLDILPELPDNSLDAVCTDPPYNLSDSGKRDGDCLRRILLDIGLPDDKQRNGQTSQSGDLAHTDTDT